MCAGLSNRDKSANVCEWMATIYSLPNRSIHELTVQCACVCSPSPSCSLALQCWSPTRWLHRWTVACLWLIRRSRSVATSCRTRARCVCSSARAVVRPASARCTRHRVWPKRTRPLLSTTVGGEVRLPGSGETHLRERLRLMLTLILRSSCTVFSTLPLYSSTLLYCSTRPLLVFYSVVCL
jgi:hypothetical protein